MSGDTAILTTVANAVRSAVQDGARLLVELLGRMVRGLRDLAPVVLAAAGCTSERVDAAGVSSGRETTAVTRPEPVVPPTATEDDAGPRPIGKFSFTFYYMTSEQDVEARAAARAARVAEAAPAREDDGDPVGELAAITVQEQITLREGGTCKPIAEVSKEYAAHLALQGTGQLRDGRVINIWGRCSCDHSPCFKVTRTKWGTAGNGRSLRPFRTVAVDPRVIKLGTLLHVPQLEGRTMPGRAPWGGFVHDGCVIADDTGGGITGKQIDLFVGRRKHYQRLSGTDKSHAWARNLPVFDGSQICERVGQRVRRKAAAI